MRKIESEMLYAIRHNEAWHKDNTEVVVDGDKVLVYMHNNLIAVIDGDGYVAPNLQVIKKWPSKTTLSRLTALGVDIKRRRGKVYINNQEI